MGWQVCPALIVWSMCSLVQKWICFSRYHIIWFCFTLTLSSCFPTPARNPEWRLRVGPPLPLPLPPPPPSPRVFLPWSPFCVSDHPQCQWLLPPSVPLSAQQHSGAQLPSAIVVASSPSSDLFVRTHWALVGIQSRLVLRPHWELGACSVATVRGCRVCWAGIVLGR